MHTLSLGAAVACDGIRVCIVIRIVSPGVTRCIRVIAILGCPLRDSSERLLSLHLSPFLRSRKKDNQAQYGGFQIFPRRDRTDLQQGEVGQTFQRRLNHPSRSDQIDNRNEIEAIEWRGRRIGREDERNQDHCSWC